MEELKNLLRNPYEPNVLPSDAPNAFNASNSSVKKRSPSNKKYSKIKLSNKKGSNSVDQAANSVGRKVAAFGSTSRRPVGEKSIQEIVSFTYIPDIRRMHAISSQQLKEQRFAERMATIGTTSASTGGGYLKSNQSLRKLHPNASERMLARQETSFAQLKAQMAEEERVYGSMTAEKG